MNHSQEYFKTGIDWIPEIPDDWEIIRAKYLFSNKSTKNNQNQPLLSVTQTDGVVIREDSELRVWNPSDDVSMYKLIEPNDFVISLRSFEGGIELSNVEGIVSPAYTVLQPSTELYHLFFKQLLKSHQFIIELNRNVTGIRQGKTISWDDFSDICLPFPPLRVQQQIANYLDEKTTQIDSLIEKIERKIELLKEQRTALINQAVTKGLDPNVEMKDSGVEWIGMIPEKWFVGKLRWFINSIKDGTHGSHLSVDEGHLLLSGKNVHDGFLKIKDNERRISNASHLEITKNGFPKRGDVLVSCVGSIGRSCVYELDEKISFQRSVCFIRPSERIDSYFLSYLIRSKFCQEQLITLTNQSTIGGVYMSDILDLVITIPSIQEQTAIANYLDEKTTQIDSIIEKETKRIELLKKYRQSLISNVVTGKVRVVEDQIYSG